METDRNEAPLSSWKEIGAYLQRNEATARRWEKEEALPVHRHSHKTRSSVYAYPSEIDAWRASRKLIAEPPPPVPLWRSLFATPRSVAFVATMLACLVMIGNGIRPVSAQQARSGALAKRMICGEDCGDDADVSSDGRWIVNTDWDTGDLAIHDLLKGKTRRLFAKAGSYHESDAHAESPAFSPDMRQVAYIWDPGNRGESPQLRVIDNRTGAKPRVVIDNPGNAWLKPYAWSPDGKSILVSLKKPDNAFDLVSVSAADGHVSILKSLGPRNFKVTRSSFSPDGRDVVYAAHPDSATTDMHIYVLAVDDSSETDVAPAAGLNSNPVWTPDGAHILFTSDRSGAFGLWSVAVKNGKAAGPPQMVTPNTGRIEGIGLRSGSYYYTQNGNGTQYVSIAAVKSESGRILESLVGQAAAWSPDGKSIAFKQPVPGNEGHLELVVRSMETSEERRYPTNGGVMGPAAPVWFHDGKSIITGVMPEAGKPWLYKVDLKTGDFQDAQIGRTQPVAISLDDKAVYTIRPLEGAPAHIVKIDLSTRLEKEIAPLRDGRSINFLKLSPDGRMLALVRQDARTKQSYVIRVGVDGSDYREIYTTGPFGITWDVTWTADGGGVLVAKVLGNRRQILRVPVDGSAPVATGLEMTSNSGTQFIDASPDGSRIAFNTRKNIQELWALDNVLSGLK